MKNIFTLVVVFLYLQVGAQMRGTEWLNYSANYYKFPVYKDGFYQLDSAVLAQAFNLSATNSQDFKLFIRGKEVRLYVNDGGDNLIHGNDFIQFYAEPNTTEIDSLIYRKDIQYLPNPYRPLFNDTIYAFLTLNNASPNLRYAVNADTLAAGTTTAAYVYRNLSSAYFNASGWYSINGYNIEDFYNGEVSDPNYTQIEAKGINFLKGVTLTTTLNPNIYNVNPNLPVYLTTVFSGNSRQSGAFPDHQIRFSYRNTTSADVILFDTTFYGYVGAKKQFTLSAGDLLASTLFSITSVAAPSFTFDNYTLLNYLNVYHPMQLNLSGLSTLKFTAFTGNSSQPTLLQFSNFSNFGGNPLVYDLSNGKVLSPVYSGNSIRFNLSIGSGNPVCALSAGGNVINVSSLKPVNGSGKFNRYTSTGTRKVLAIIYPDKLSASALQYATYRNSMAGGNYEVITAPIESLYEQFAYGINKHPLAIRNFAHYLKDSLANPVSAIFIIGKGIAQKDLFNPQQAENLVPAYGVPSSDHLYTSALDNNDYYYPQIPIGRLAVLTNSDVVNYLEKVQQHEQSGNAAWKKNVLHFVGGDDEVLNARLKQFMDGYKMVLQDTLFGASVSTFMKNTSAPIFTEISDTIRRMIDNGCSIMNFFGHGSEQGFDQAIDDPNVYNNAGRYPIIIANSCYSGNVFSFNSISVSERFVNSKQKGSIGFIATSSYGFDTGLDNFTRGFTRAIAQTHYGKPLGEIMKEAARLNSLAGDQTTPFVGMEMCLNGDPALLVNVGPLPDYQIKNNQVLFDTKSRSDSIRISVIIKNPNKAIKDSVWLRITRFFPNNDSLVIRKNIVTPLNVDTVHTSVFLDFDRGIGLNKFKVTIDDVQKIAELDETNNSTIGTVDLLVPGGDILPVIPHRFAIVPKSNQLILKASTSDPFAPKANYRLQLDTAASFAAPISQTVITSAGGVIEWPVSLLPGDSIVYYWRVSRDSISESQKFIWRESSFQTIGDKTGWGQSRFPQFKDNFYQYVSYDKPAGKFVFRNTKNSVSSRVAVFPTIHISYINSFYNTLALDLWSPSFNGWNIAVFDSASAKPWRAVTTNTPFGGMGVYGNCVGNSGDRWVFSFGPLGDCQPNMTNWRQDLENFLNIIPNNSYVLAYSTPFVPPYANYSSYNNSLYTAFEKFGVSKIRNTADTLAYTFFGRKGMAIGSAHELVGTNKSSILYLFDTLSTAWNNGFVASPAIGPAKKWSSLYWRVRSTDSQPGDSTRLKLLGIRANGSIDTLFTLPQDSTDIVNLANRIDANLYPSIQLLAAMSDDKNKTSPQLSYWRVYYEPAPECAINPLKGFKAVNDSLQEGDLAEFRVPIENISNTNFNDSLVITYWLEDQNRNKTPLKERYIQPALKAGDVWIDTLRVNSYSFVGDNQLWMYVNNTTHPRYQNEQESFNNIAKFDFAVSKDKTNPLLDVTFDGIRILNGDIVSAKPTIVISLKDENKFLALNDTAAFSVWLSAPGSSTRNRVYFSDVLQFTPAQLPKNSAVLTYKPVFQTDGTYQLMVQARDRSSNKAGSNEYAVEFEINSKPGITQVLNYPNPFTTNTKFVFTLTGSEIPEVFTIQIMTITGKVVREITRDELGPLHIGRNITEYGWDGRDNFGDRLANGVYLYRVITRLNGQSMDTNASGADKFFVKDIGKMVLLR